MHFQSPFFCRSCNRAIERQDHAAARCPFRTSSGVKFHDALKSEVSQSVQQQLSELRVAIIRRVSHVLNVTAPVREQTRMLQWRADTVTIVTKAVPYSVARKKCPLCFASILSRDVL